MSKSKPANFSGKQTKFETRLGVEKKIHNSYVSFDIVTFAIYGKNNGNMVVSEYQNFFSFQNVTYAYPPYAVNVTFIPSHIKVSRSSLDRIYQHDCFTFHVGFFFIFFFLTWSWIEVFFKEILLIIINFCITMSEIELVFRRAGRQCSRSLFSMLLFKKLYLMQIFNQYLYIKRVIHVHFWIRIYLFELNNLFEGVKDVMNARW